LDRGPLPGTTRRVDVETFLSILFSHFGIQSDSSRHFIKLWSEVPSMVAAYGGRIKNWHVMDNPLDGYMEIDEIQSALRGLDIKEYEFWAKISN